MRSRLLSRRLLLPTLSLAAVVGVVTACSDERPAEGSATPLDSPNTATLADNAHGVRGEPLEMDDFTVTFADNGETASFKVGDVIAPRERIKKPYLRKILGSDRKDGRLIFKTRSSSLTELFKEAHIHQKISFGDSSWTSVNPAVMEAPLTKQSLSLGSGLRPQTVEALPGGSASFNFGGRKLEFGAAGGYFDPSKSYVQVGGGIEFDYDYEAWYDPTPTGTTTSTPCRRASRRTTPATAARRRRIDASSTRCATASTTVVALAARRSPAVARTATTPSVTSASSCSANARSSTRTSPAPPRRPRCPVTGGDCFARPLEL